MINFFTLIIIMGITSTWFFTKKKPDKKKTIISIIVSVIAFLGFGLFTELEKKDNTNNKTEKITEKTIVSSENTKIKKEKKHTNKTKSSDNNEKYNKDIAENLELKKGWANGSIDEDGNSTDTGEPNPEYTVWLIVSEIKVNDPKNIDVKVTADFEALPTGQKSEIASTIQGMVLSSTVVDGETKRYPIYFYNGKNALGGSKVLEPTEFKWNE
ncbi:hypothetical protein [Vagococcus sp.]|uniref:hypothetical protein n=1 Tax=Vagococcus sp. TaxID=1933889 RepID=UPI002FC682F6